MTFLVSILCIYVTFSSIAFNMRLCVTFLVYLGLLPTPLRLDLIKLFETHPVPPIPSPLLVSISHLSS